VTEGGGAIFRLGRRMGSILLGAAPWAIGARDSCHGRRSFRRSGDCPICVGGSAAGVRARAFDAGHLVCDRGAIAASRAGGGSSYEFPG